MHGDSCTSTPTSSYMVLCLIQQWDRFTLIIIIIIITTTTTTTTIIITFLIITFMQGIYNFSDM